MPCSCQTSPPNDILLWPLTCCLNHFLKAKGNHAPFFPLERNSVQATGWASFEALVRKMVAGHKQHSCRHWVEGLVDNLFCGWGVLRGFRDTCMLNKHPQCLMFTMFFLKDHQLAPACCDLHDDSSKCFFWPPSNGVLVWPWFIFQFNVYWFINFPIYLFIYLHIYLYIFYFVIHPHIFSLLCQNSILSQ